MTEQAGVCEPHGDAFGGLAGNADLTFARSG